MSRAFSILFFFFFTFLSAHANFVFDEPSALLAIKAGLVDPLDALGDWKAETTHCNWTGIQCNAAAFIESINISHMNLSGIIAFELFRILPVLNKLNLCCNSFNGPLPKTFPILSELRELDISDNNFAGPFPGGIGTFRRLKTLNASGNYFVGSLPANVGNTSLLETLDFRGSFFIGSIPSTFKNLQKLKFLGLSGNNLTGELPAELFQLSYLETIIIGYNGFEGSIPAGFGNLTNLRYLDMAVGSLRGPIPAEIGKLTHLAILYLYKNNLRGEIPKEMGNITSLISLDLSDNMISGHVPTELTQLANLQLLNLMCNRLEGLVPPGLGDILQLQVLELWNNSFVGPLPSSLGRDSALQWLDVSSNSISGIVPPGLCDNSKLKELILFNNKLSGPIPASLSTCPSLVRVRMHNNRLNGTVPSGIGRLPNLQWLELADNDLSGDIPEDLSFSTSLSFIDFSRNRIQLSLPTNLLSIPTLQTFIASGSELAGEIPTDVKSCLALSTLDLSGNRLTGTIPANLASCQRLVILNLRDNDLTGEIPVAISVMPALAILDLSCNSLSGFIPETFGVSPALETLNLSYNKLSGPVPVNGVLRTINPSDLAGNPELCGGVLPACSRNYPPIESLSGCSSRIMRVAVGWSIGILAVLAAGAGLLLARRMYARRYINDAGCFACRFDDSQVSTWPWRLTAFQRLSFTSNEVLGCLKEANVIGMGATGIVYKAEMTHPHDVIAVKKLWRPSGPVDDASEFLKEVNLLGRLRHRNIVRMLGYLYNDANTMILYEYMSKGSLWDALHSVVLGCSVLVDWVSRYNVAVGVAQGLAYLHHDCHPPVIHRDVKSSNILLDENLDARIADFGLARTILRKNETLSTVAGSYGYIAPEYGYTMKVDQKSDIYSFGVVLMELVTGKRPVESEFGEGQDIVGWVRESLKSDHPPADQVPDPTIACQSKHVQEEMLLLLRIALLCTSQSPKDRPSMRNVLAMLSEAKPRRKGNSFDIDMDNNVKPIFTASPLNPGFL